MARLNGLVLTALSVLMLVSGLPWRAAADEKPLTKITFSLDFIPLGRHAPWYAAIAEGYYKQEGLDVSIIPSQGTAQTIQAIEAGTGAAWFHRCAEPCTGARQRRESENGRRQLREGAVCDL